MKNKMFVIQSLPRCGTHLLRTALDSHPDIDCLGDVFDPNSSGRHGFPKLRPTPAEVITYCSTQARLTGFVAHAHAGLAEDETGAGLDEAYRAQPEVRAGPGLWQAIPPATPVITLWRRNLLARHVSQLVAQHSSVWAVRRGDPLPPPPRLKVDCSQMLADFARIRALMEIARRRFPAALRVSYEQLVEQADTSFAKIQEFLGVVPKSLSPRTAKQGRPLAETIINLDEVEATLRGTHDARFLEMRA